MSTSNKLLLKRLAVLLSRLKDERVRQIAEKVFEEIAEENTPLPGSVCKGCGGRVVQKASSYFRGIIHYSLPECEKCGRIYLYAKHAPRVGGGEFLRSLHEPMTIWR